MKGANEGSEKKGSEGRKDKRKRIREVKKEGNEESGGKTEVKEGRKKRKGWTKGRG